MGPGHLLLHEAFRRAANDRVQRVPHLDPPLLRQNPQVKRPRDLHLPEVPGLQV